MEDLVPKNKFDNSNIERLRELSDEEIRPMLPRLLEWIQDINWPVAEGVLSVLKERGEVIWHIIDLLDGDDEVWKYNVITALLPEFSAGELKPLIGKLRRMADEPTEGEKREEVDLAAAELLRGLTRNGDILEKIN